MRMRQVDNNGDTQTAFSWVLINQDYDSMHERRVANLAYNTLYLLIHPVRRSLTCALAGHAQTFFLSTLPAFESEVADTNLIDYSRELPPRHGLPFASTTSCKPTILVNPSPAVRYILRRRLDGPVVKTSKRISIYG